MPPEKKKGHAFVQTTKGLFPYSTLMKAEVKTPGSKQIKEAKKWMIEQGLIPHPYNLNSILELYESNSTFWACVNQIARDVVGQGWKLVLREGKKENTKELQKIKEFLDQPNDEEQSLRIILKQLLIDWGSLGNYGLEVIRNKKHEIAKIFRVPAHTLWVHESKDKYCQKRNNKKVWFKRFGLEADIDSTTGKEISDGAGEPADELIYYTNFYSKSDYYGLPNAIAAIGDVIGLIAVRDYNLAFFENFGVPSAIIVLEGNWDDDTERVITKFIRDEITGTEKAHKTLVMSQPEGCKFVYTPLETKLEKEGAFKVYAKDIKENVMSAYSMPPERIGVRVVGKLGGNVAEEATRIYIHSVVTPMQEDMEDVVNKLLASEIYKFKFNNIDLRDYKEIIERGTKAIQHGVSTPNEVRNELGLMPYPDGDRFYMASTLIEVGEPEEGLSK